LLRLLESGFATEQEVTTLSEKVPNVNKNDKTDP